MKTRLTHARANVRDLAAAIRWYTEVLGFELESTWPPQNPNYAHFIAGEGAVFGIMAVDPVPCGGRFNFSVDDVDELWSRLGSRAPVVEALFDTAYGTRKFTIQDPDGNELGFVQA
ncbi:MAG: VOC family protein [Myxococcales bacterium]|nr:VOC family protein [Myxococcales bacterium]